uniref:NADH-ubiquinone oxidoreductase chain 4L n=1 Tax=Omoglymmius wukong TaxID=2983420 RepID=A0A977XTT2_9CARA|nr:NADH dehydrogenase subunit 4L [Omoglymmius wukong]UXW93695.1 NADH dehydrogenase subunit 4L [Omoglymmius wukong]
MYLLNIMVFIIMFIIGGVVFSLKSKHLMMMLMSLEFIILSLFIILFIILFLYNQEYYFCMYFLTFCVCESVLGLSVLVALIRTHSNDYYNILNMC